MDKWKGQALGLSGAPLDPAPVWGASHSRNRCNTQTPNCLTPVLCLAIWLPAIQGAVGGSPGATVRLSTDLRGSRLSEEKQTL